MLSTGYELFIQDPSTSKPNYLHPGTVKTADGENYTIEFEDHSLNFLANSDGFIYFNLNREFMKQAVHISKIIQASPTLILEIQATNKPVSAENRQTFRVSAVISQRTAVVSDESNCPLLDVSATGLAVATTATYDFGQRIAVTIEHDGKQYAGQATVQSIRELGSGKIRHGLCAVDTSKELLKGLQQLSMAVQREQLKRLSRSAS